LIITFQRFLSPEGYFSERLCPTTLYFEAAVGYHAASPCKTHRRKGGGGGAAAEITYGSELIHVPFPLFS